METGCKNHRETLYSSKGKVAYVMGKPCNIYRLRGNPIVVLGSKSDIIKWGHKLKSEKIGLGGMRGQKTQKSSDIINAWMFPKNTLYAAALWCDLVCIFLAKIQSFYRGCFNHQRHHGQANSARDGRGPTHGEWRPLRAEAVEHNNRNCHILSK